MMNSCFVIGMLLMGADPTAEAVELKTDTGTLYGVLDLPDGKGPWPVVLLHPGSGPTDRDGNSAFTKNDSLKKLGSALASGGVACLRIDKRGIAASGKAYKKEEELSLDTYADDVAAWLKLIKAEKRFTKFGFIGHSEGSMIGAIAAPKAGFDAFVSLCGPGRKLADVLREQLKQNAPSIVDACEPIIKSLEAGKVHEGQVPKDLVALFRPSVQPFLISSFKRDPVKDLAAVSCPLFVVSGTTDIQVKEADYKLLVECRKNVKSVRIDKMNHVLKDIESTNPVAQSMTYTDPKKALHPKLAEELLKFFEVAFQVEKK